MRNSRGPRSTPAIRHSFESKPVKIIGAAWRAGAPVPGAEAGPDALLAQGLDVAPIIRADAAEENASDPIGSVSRLAARLSTEVTRITNSGGLPVVIGGDHSCAIGTWRGVAAASDGPIGLLWIDAHLDAHVPGTTPSGAVHGMPLAALLGAGDARLTGGDATLRPEHVAVIGVRSFEADEAALLLRLGVRVFGMAEIDRRGLDVVIQDALAVVRSGTCGFGVTIDLDAIDPRDAPGVSTPVADGIRADELLDALGIIDERGDEPVPLLALEIAEFNPSRDSNDRTALLVRALIGIVTDGSQRKDPDAGSGADRARRLMALEAMHGAHNYAPLPVVLARGAGVHLWDVTGKRYLDMMSAYSAVSLGHAHPRILEVLHEQAGTLGVTSRAFFNDRLPVFLQRLCALTGMDEALPVNTGLEAVETALKAARKWAYRIKGVPTDRAEIIACDGNFHGRSIAIVGMSSEAQYRDGFGPFPPGFRRIPFGDIHALEQAITAHTAAFLVEPVQGEGGIIVPPTGYLAACAALCRERNVLLICDEVQTGLARTGRFLASEHEQVVPDGVILGKALGGGLLPVSAFVAKRHVMQVFSPGDHGSTFGGNPLAAAVGLAALDLIVEGRLAARAAELGAHFMARLRELRSPLIREIRGLGLLIGVELDPRFASARVACERLMLRGILSKDTHGTVIRFAPPLIIARADIDWTVRELGEVLRELEALPQAA